MYVILGGTGHVGSATAESLLGHNQKVIILSRHPERGQASRTSGAEIVKSDVNDIASLNAALQRGNRAFLLNPPADPSGDTDAEERRTIANILTALEGTGLEKVVAASTGGAQPGHRLGDLSTLWELEEGLRRQSIPAAINRGAYYMSNWDEVLGKVRDTGKLPTMFPADLPIPMVAPRDLGEVAAARLMSDLEDTGVRYIEGPRRYSPSEVAAAYSSALGQPVDVEVIPRDKWMKTYLELGFSEAAAESYCRMTATTIDQGFDSADSSIRGSTTLERYISGLVGQSNDADR